MRKLAMYVICRNTVVFLGKQANYKNESEKISSTQLHNRY
jgi:hypothetical protein